MLSGALASGGLLDGLGINLKVVAVQVVVFSATFVILSRTLFGRALQNMQRREEELRKAKEEIERDRAQTARLAREIEDRLRSADQEGYAQAQAILKEALATAASLTAKAQSDAKAEVDRAKAEIEAEKRAALAGLQGQAGRLALEAAEKVLETRLDPSAHGALVESYLQERSRP
jgi:F-type H+-transporting ATPase subunit b